MPFRNPPAPHCPLPPARSGGERGGVNHPAGTAVACGARSTARARRRLLPGARLVSVLLAVACITAPAHANPQEQPPARSVADAPASAATTGAVPLAVRLQGCADTPDCVTTQAGGAGQDGQYVEPLPFTGDAKAAIRRLAVNVAALPGCTVVELEELTLRAECRSRVLGLVDDMICTADPEGSVIHLRSAARLGWWDTGNNRDRAEQLRRRFMGFGR